MDIFSLSKNSGRGDFIPQAIHVETGVRGVTALIDV